jgi:hypothetical protein
MKNASCLCAVHKSNPATFFDRDLHAGFHANFGRKNETLVRSDQQVFSYVRRTDKISGPDLRAQREKGYRKTDSVHTYFLVPACLSIDPFASRSGTIYHEQGRNQALSVYFDGAKGFS